MKEVSIEITHDCALKCIFCSSSAEHPSPLGELSFEAIKSIIDDAVSCGATIVSISGGEPLLHKEIFPILTYCNELNLQIALYTSGVLFDKAEQRTAIDRLTWNRMHDLLQGNLTVIFDVQSCDVKNVEILNDVKNSFQIIIKSINNAIQENIACEIHVVPMKQNYKEILKILKFCKELGIKKVSFLRFVPQGRGVENIDKLSLSAEEFFELQGILYNAIKTFGADFIRLGHPIDFLFSVDSQCEITPCRGGTDAPLVLPNGDVHMCPAWKNLKKLKAGNIFSSGLKSVWETSDFYSKFRELTEQTSLIKGPCKDCSLLPRCKGGCTAQRILLFDNLNIPFPEIMYLSPDPICPLLNNYALQKKLRAEKEHSGGGLDMRDILSTMITLHEKKTKSYGDAWKKRGEVISILPNIARKIDRLEKASLLDEIADGENVLDTLVDLCVYCVKYLVFLVESSQGGVELFLNNLRWQNFTWGSDYLDSDVARSLAAIADFYEAEITDCKNNTLSVLMSEISTQYKQLESIAMKNIEIACIEDTKNQKVEILSTIVTTSLMCIYTLASKDMTQYSLFRSNIYNM